MNIETAITELTAAVRENSELLRLIIDRTTSPAPAEPAKRTKKAPVVETDDHSGATILAYPTPESPAPEAPAPEAPAPEAPAPEAPAPEAPAPEAPAPEAPAPETPAPSAVSSPFPEDPIEGLKLIKNHARTVFGSAGERLAEKQQILVDLRTEFGAEKVDHIPHDKLEDFYSKLLQRLPL